MQNDKRVVIITYKDFNRNSELSDICDSNEFSRHSTYVVLDIIFYKVDNF